VADSLGIVRASPDQPIKELSGGNQQKVVMAQGILTRPKILIVDDPTQGVDVRARLDIWRVLAEQASQGAAVIVNSSDSGELAGLCNRVYVLSRGRVVKEITGPEITEAQIVSSFVDVGASGESSDGVIRSAGKNLAEAGTGAVDLGRRVVERLRAGASGAFGSYSLLPLTVLVLLMIGLGIYTQSKSSGVFLSSSNLLSLLNLAVPLAIVAMAQLVALLSADFDISVGSTMSVTVVVMSYVATGTSIASTLPGIALVLAIGAAIGLLNSFIVRILKVNPIIATIGTLDILQGVAILVRPSPGGIVSIGLEEALTKSILGFLPIAFIAVVVVAILADLLRTKANPGLTHRATGLAEESARRTGVAVGRGHVASYLVAAIGAAIAGIFLACQTGIGDNTAGAGYPLQAFTVCFLAGASLTGGRGSFVGVVLGALFLTMLINITPLVEVNNSASQILTGVFTILAVVAYSLRSSLARRFGSRASSHAAGAPALASGAAE
jgi:ribose transport system ATP-binding protein